MKWITPEKFNAQNRSVLSHPAYFRLKWGLVLGFLALGIVAGVSPASAATEYWDTGTATGLQGGAGTWDAGTTASWSTSTSGSNPLVTWTADSDASFQTGGTYAVSVSGTVDANSVQVNGSSTVLTLNDGTIQIDGTTGILNNSNASAMTINSALTLNSAYVTVGASNSSTILLGGDIGETGGSRALRTTGAVTLSGSNSFSGGIQVNPSSAAVPNSITITNGNALGSGTVDLSTSNPATTTVAALNANLSSDATIANAFKFNLGGSGVAGAVSINSTGSKAVNYSNTGAITFGAVVGGSTTTGLLTINFGGTSNGANTFAGVIKDSGTGANLTSVAKVGAGSWTLTGSNTYTGGTTVKAGTLGVTGGLSSSGSLAVGAGANFALGEGAGGGSFLSQTVSTLSLTSTGSGSGNAPILSFNLNGASYDSITSTGALTLAGSTFELNLTGASTGTDKLLTWLASGSTAITIANIDLTLNGTDYGTGNPYLTIVQSGGNDILELNAIPEPSTWAMMIGGLAVLILWQRRRNAP